MKGTASRSGAAPTRGDSDHGAVFRALRSILTKIDQDFIVSSDTATRYCLDAGVGTATLKEWGGKLRRPTIPVA